MKMKVSKKFQAMPVNSDDELFPNGIFEFNITKMLAFIKSNPEKFAVELVPLEELGSSFGDLNESTIEKAELSSPIILAEISPGRFNVIDGHHRAEKARRVGATNVPAYRVYPDVHHRFFTSDRAYQTYVDYWNTKINEHAREQRVLAHRSHAKNISGGNVVGME